MKLGARRADVVQKFVPRSCVGIFRNERIRSTPLHRKLTFWCVSYYLGAFGTFGCLMKLGAKWAELMQKFVPRSRRQNFLQRTQSIRPIGPQTDVLVRFVIFGCIWDHLVALRNPVQNGSNWCKSSCHEVASEFFATNAPDPPHWTLNSCFGAFIQFWCIWDHLVDLRNSVQNGPNWCKSSCYEVALEFFAMNAPDPLHWTLNSCFGAFVQ